MDLTSPDFYDFFHAENVRFSDTDMVGHVNNVAHVALVESGRIAYAFSLAEQAGTATGAITFAHLSIDFRADLYYPNTVRIGARVLKVGRTSFTVGIAVFSGATDDLVCVTTSENVLVHLGEGGGPAPLPDPFRAVLAAEVLAEPAR